MYFNLPQGITHSNIPLSPFLSLSLYLSQYLFQPVPLLVHSAALTRCTMNDNDVRILLARPPNGRTSGPSTGHMFHGAPAPAPAPHATPLRRVT